MKPRFSILTLLGITAYVAVNVAAFARPTTIWISIAFWIAFVVIVALLVAASGRTSNQSVFARGMLLGVLVYDVLRRWEPGSWFGWEWSYFRVDSHSELFEVMANRQTLAMQSSQLAFGLLGGCLALWRYRRNERREKQESV